MVTWRDVSIQYTKVKSMPVLAAQKHLVKVVTWKSISIEHTGAQRSMLVKAAKKHLVSVVTWKHI